MSASNLERCKNITRKVARLGKRSKEPTSVLLTVAVWNGLSAESQRELAELADTLNVRILTAEFTPEEDG